MLAEPVQDQFEQSVNVTGLEALGIGRGTRKLGVEDRTQAALLAVQKGWVPDEPVRKSDRG